LSMVPLIVTKAMYNSDIELLTGDKYTALERDRLINSGKRKTVLYSFSYPEYLGSSCSAVVKEWKDSLSLFTESNNCGSVQFESAVCVQATVAL